MCKAVSMTFARRLAALLCLPLLIPAVGAEPIHVERDIPYTEEVALDLYTDEDSRLPLIIFVHGGGWRAGDKAVAERFARSFVDLGYAVASVNYRFVPEATVQEAADDIAEAIYFMAANEVGANYDPSRIAVMGHSAGAHLAAFAAFTLYSPGTVDALVLLDGVGYDFAAQMDLQPGLANLMREYTSSWNSVSPINFVEDAPDEMATFVAAGNDERQTKAQAQALGAALQAAGKLVELTLYPDLAHNDFLAQVSREDSDLSYDVRSFLAQAFRQPG